MGRQRREDFLARYRFVFLRSHRHRIGSVIRLYCQHARCRVDCPFGIRLAIHSRYPFDSKHGLLHVGRQFVIDAWEDESHDVLWEENEHHGHDRDSPQHDLVHRHHVEAATAALFGVASAIRGRSRTIALSCRFAMGTVGDVESKAEKPEGDRAKQGPVGFERSSH